MEKNSTPSICKMGCGFFGNHSLEGMCSKCHKDSIKRNQLSPTTGTDSTPSNIACDQSKSKQQEKKPVVAATETPNLSKVDAATVVPKTIPCTSLSSSQKEPEGCTSADGTCSVSEKATSSISSPRKRNRCFSCKKRVGLTGCECRCGEIFCGLHRYSDKHNCTFDYKTDGRKRLAQENPVIVGEKIKKI